jgi:predicted DsbA family dithiol-disulfide isomerase
MHEALLASGTKLSGDGMLQRAQALGLDMPRFRDCVTHNKYESAIARNAAESASLGVRGTPTFIIGRSVHGELDGVRVAGALPYEEFAAYLDEALAGH